MNKKMTKEELLVSQQQERSVNISIAFVTSLPVGVLCSLVYNIFIASEFNMFRCFGCLFTSMAVMTMLGMLFQLHKIAHSICCRFGFDAKSIQGMIAKAAFIGVILGLICTVSNVLMTINADKRNVSNKNWSIVQEEYQPQLVEIQNEIYTLNNSYVYNTDGTIDSSDYNLNIQQQINTKENEAEKIYEKIETLESKIPSFGSRFRFSIAFMLISAVIGAFITVPFADKIEVFLRKRMVTEE